MECYKSSDIISVIFKMKSIEKNIINISNTLKGIKVLKYSFENYRTCLNYYNEGSRYFFQCSGFLKSQYFSSNISDVSKAFLINNLFIPTQRSFLNLKKSLSLIQVEEVYSMSTSHLKEQIEHVNSALFELQRDLERID